MKSLIWPTATNGCEGWTLKKADQKCIEAFEMWGFRRLLRIPWTQRKTNEWILEKLNEDRQLLNSIKTRKIRYYGHVMRKPSCLEKDIVQGCISGSRSRGRQRRRWTENIVDWTSLDINTAARLTEDRHRWHHVLLTANSPGGRH